MSLMVGHPRIIRSLDWIRDRVQVTDSGCWEWQNYRTIDGYGRFTVKARTVGYVETFYAHRAAYEASHGPIPKGMAVCHRCDNPPCCSPDHLFLGTYSVNQRDCRDKGRLARAKLSVDQVRQVRNLLSRGESHSAIARLFGVSPNAIWQIRHGRSWAA